MGASARLEGAITIGVCVAAVVILLVLWRRDVIRPGSLGPVGAGAPGKRDPSQLAPVGWLLCACTAFMSPAIGIGIVASLPDHMIGAKDSLKYNAVTALAGSTAAVALCCLLLHLVAKRAPNAGARFRWKDLLVGVWAFLLILPIVIAINLASTAIYTWLTKTTPDVIAHHTLEQIVQEPSDPWRYGLMGAAAFGAPIQEEITFRIFLQSALVLLFLNRWAAVLGASILFALVHRIGAQPVPWHAIAPIFALGFAAGVAYERTGRPGVPIMIHALFNIANLALVLAT